MFSHQLRLIFGKMPLFEKCLQVIENRCFLSGSRLKIPKNLKSTFSKSQKSKFFKSQKSCFWCFWTIWDIFGFFKFFKKYFPRKKNLRKKYFFEDFYFFICSKNRESEEFGAQRSIFRKDGFLIDFFLMTPAAAPTALQNCL